jgi:hypothetical protein
MKKHSSTISLAAVAAISLLNSGCASDPKPAPAPAPAPAEQAAAPQDKPGKALVGHAAITATVKAIDKKNRVVTLKYPDGKEAKIKCGPEVRNFAQIQVGDDVRAEFVESVELYIADSPEKPDANETVGMQRAPLGAKPSVKAVESAEVKATVEAIDYKTREVTLRGPEGKLQKLTVGPAAKRFNEVKPGDTVVARLTKAVSIEVSTPAKKKK